MAAAAQFLVAEMGIVPIGADIQFQNLYDHSLSTVSYVFIDDYPLSKRFCVFSELDHLPQVLNRQRQIQLLLGPLRDQIALGFFTHLKRITGQNFVLLTVNFDHTLYTRYLRKHLEFLASNRKGT